MIGPQVRSKKLRSRAIGVPPSASITRGNAVPVKITKTSTTRIILVSRKAPSLEIRDAGFSSLPGFRRRHNSHNEPARVIRMAARMYGGKGEP